MSARLFAGLIGVAAIVAALVGLSMETHPTYVHPTFGASELRCGSVLAPTDYTDTVMALTCEEALQDRAVWGWPLSAAGLVVALGAAVVRPKPGNPASVEQSG